MKCPRICKDQAIDDYTLIIEFTNQEVKQYDVRHLLENSMFAPLRQPAFFKNFKVEPGGYGIVWNEDIELTKLHCEMASRFLDDLNFLYS
ncbi:DUF2442 domain-containing protein [Gloeocapsa sp. PCC 73106]|uniref:DUF2442 domain-containing protein n=1 Tax=Gloeocapsa sp. PCC 73106 TaxID=102232 RepID=UPI0002ABDA52|nr:DUF2442 domain-containing protein [Gloeocapsa sp. PCC 73106]ELR97976.1 Protein of unknown function (DUF2442) [Gloeocapsa sp. PCC 73106]